MFTVYRGILLAKPAGDTPVARVQADVRASACARTLPWRVRQIFRQVYTRRRRLYRKTAAGRPFFPLQYPAGREVRIISPFAGATMCGTGRTFIYETGVAVKSQIATQICRADNNGASRQEETPREPWSGRRRRKRAARGQRKSRTPLTTAVISDLSVRESRSVISSGTGPRRYLAAESRCRYVMSGERS